jgi:hypothetical protein
MKQKNRFRTEKFILIAFTILILTSIVLAETTPEGPSILELNSSRRTPAQASTLDAQAGNVSVISLSGTSSTQTWQGYVGNITGTIVLDNSAGNSLYVWNISDVEGEVYASESTIDFSYGNVECYNYTKTGGSYVNLSSYETSLGLDSDDADGVDETFVAGTTYDFFYAGTNFINSDCPETQLLNSSGQKNPDQFQEVLLYDLTSNNVIYTAIIEETGQLGYDGSIWDFQMIVGENGRDGNTDTTTYYFYVEIE